MNADLICWGLLALAIVLLLMNQDKIKPAPTNAAPRKVPYTCPHCGSEASKWYTPGKERYPTLFTCYECARKCGDPTRMTDAERRELKASDTACRKAEQLPDLPRILQTVYACTSERKNFVTLKSGEIRICKKTRMETIGYFDSTGLGHIGTQRLCTLCIDYCRKKYRERGLDGWIAFELMDEGIAWEWRKI